MYNELSKMSYTLSLFVIIKQNLAELVKIYGDQLSIQIKSKKSCILMLDNVFSLNFQRQILLSKDNEFEKVYLYKIVC